MRQQIQYAKHNNAGFNDEQLLKVDAPQFQASDSTRVFQLIDRFRQYADISNVTMSNGVPGRINSYMGANMPGKDKSISIIYADSSFLNTFGITVKEGRYPLPGDYGTTCLINEAAYNYFDWTDLEDKRYNNGRAGGFEVIGVVNNFHYSSLRNTIEPLAILLQKEVYPTNISLRLAGGDIGTTMNFIRDTWNDLLPQHPLHYEFYDSWLDAMYRDDEKLGTAISLFGALAIVISCMGILGMAIFTTQRRTKEIGVRKVMGASVQDILIMITSHFIKWVLVANIFAWPVAWYAMHVWLQDFAYRIELTVWPFIFSGLVAFSVALLAVSWQVIRAATANPIESLRYE